MDQLLTIEKHFSSDSGFIFLGGAGGWKAEGGSGNMLFFSWMYMEINK